MKVIVTLTAYNEADTIATVVSSVLQLGYECIVVDDGSSDGTAEIAKATGADVIRHIVNLGQGYAVLTSFKAALAKECSVIVEMDADGQHDPREIHKFLERLEKTGADIVVGSRVLGSNHPNAPFFRKTFLPHFTAVINRLTGYKMTDSMCGFRAFKKSSLLKVNHLLDAMLEPQYLAAEMFLRFSRVGLKVDEVPVHLQDRTSGQSSKGLARYGFGVLKAILKTIFDRQHREIINT